MDVAREKVDGFCGGMICATGISDRIASAAASAANRVGRIKAGSRPFTYAFCAASANQSSRQSRRGQKSHGERGQRERRGLQHKVRHGQERGLRALPGVEDGAEVGL